MLSSSVIFLQDLNGFSKRQSEIKFSTIDRKIIKKRLLKQLFNQ